MTATLAGCAAGDAEPRVAWLQDNLVRDNQDLIARDPVRVAEKFRKMASTPYRYFRGTTTIFILDHLQGDVAPTRYGSERSARVALVGDPHPENIGTFLPADGPMVIEFNDFDGATYGPYWFDVRRLALGFVAASHQVGIGDEVAQSAARAVAASYVGEIERIADGAVAPRMVEGPELGTIMSDLVLRALRDGEDREALVEYTDFEDGSNQFEYGEVEPPGDGFEVDALGPVSHEERELVAAVVDRYRRTIDEDPGSLLDVGRRLGAGVSSYALLRYYALLEGPPGSDAPLLLELKEIRDPLPLRQLPRYPERRFATNAERVVALRTRAHGGFRTDRWLGTSHLSPLSFRVRERTKFQKGINVARIGDRMESGSWDSDDFLELAEEAGRLLARTHARGGTLGGSDATDAIDSAIGADHDGFVAESVDFALSYYLRMNTDYAAFLDLLAGHGPLLGWDPVASRRTEEVGP